MPKLSKVRVRKRGQTFSYIFEAGKKEDGKRKVVEKGGFLTRKDAYEAGAVAFADWKHGNIGITSDRILVKDFFAQWLENVAKINVRQSTYDLYSRTINQRILPYLGSTDIQKITPALLDGFMRSLVKKGLARNTILSTWRILHQALDYAVYPAELIQSNASNYIKVPKSAPRDLVKRTIISPQKYSELMSLYPFGSPLHVPIALLYHTGMRIGEVLGVCWEDVDFRQNVIHVRRQYVYLSKIGNALLPPKTPSSTRDVVIDDELVSILRKWKRQQREWELSDGGAYCVIDEQENHVLRVFSKELAPSVNRQMMLCTNRHGRPVCRATVMQHLQSAGLNAHSFRHSHATILVEAGASLKGVAGRLGHKRIETTEEIYTHNTKKMQEDVASIFAKTMQTNGECRQNADK